MDARATGRLDGRVVVVTGGNGGIGLGMADAMALAGADVAIWGRDEAKNAAAVDRLRHHGHRAESFAVDVSNEASVDDTFARTVDTMGRVDSLFANAGTPGNGVPFWQQSLDEWRRVMSVNLDGVFLCLRAAAAHMVERGEGGSLVLVSSTSAIHGAAGNEAYGTAKTGLLGLTRALAVALARYQVRVNALCPGWTITDMARGGYENDRFRAATVQRTPVRRWADPSEMGAAAVFLADPTQMFHTGDHLVVDGGYTVF
jgi:NAD(P)-dependent dehydrogenase (short-subunit alcohol dehydrogenase family)